MSHQQDTLSPSSLEEEKAELQAVLESGLFTRAPNLVHLLSYLCQKYFQGETSQLKEYTIGVEVFDRTVDFHQKEDSIVRVEVNRLRKRLKQYYETEGAGHVMQIDIPLGQYLPVFRRRPPLVVAARARLPQAGSQDTAPAAPDWSAPQAENSLASENLLSDDSSRLESPVSDFGPTIPKKRLAVKGRWLGLGLGLSAVLVMLAFKLGPFPQWPTGLSVSVPSIASSLSTALPEGDEIRILAGSKVTKYVDQAGKVWLGDRYFTGGDDIETPKYFIYRTLDPEIYWTGRQGDFSYDIPLKQGVYEMRLHFAETIYGHEGTIGGGEGSRTITVSANNQTLLNHYDIISDAAGARTADIKVFRDISPAADGFLHLKVSSWLGKGLLNGLEILPAKAGEILPVRLTARDTSYYSRDGRYWSPDRYFKGGRTVTRTGLAGADDPGLYHNERFGNFSYAIPAPPGRYTVILRFAERYYGPTNEGGGGVQSRIFNVSCNGQILLKNFDVFQEAGGENRALVKTFRGLETSVQGKLLLEFMPVKDFALLNAIEVIDEAKR